MQVIQRPTRYLPEDHGVLGTILHPRHDPFLTGMDIWLGEMYSRIGLLHYHVQKLRFPQREVGPQKVINTKAGQILSLEDLDL